MRAYLAACVLLICTASAVAAQDAQPEQTQNKNTRMLPDISVVGDLLGDFSPNRSTQESRARFGVREVELALQAAVDPYFRGDVFIGFHDEGAAVEQAFITTMALPAALELKIGRFLMPFGKQNQTHRHDLHTVDHSYVVQDFLGAEGLKGDGLWLSRVFAPFAFYQEIQLTVVDKVGAGHSHEHEEEEEPIPLERANSSLGGLGYSARLRNYWDLSESSNIELSGSVVTGKRPVAFEEHVPGICMPADDEDHGCVTGANVRQTVVGADFTYRWRPLAQGLYKSFILQAEVMKQLNASDTDVPDPFTSDMLPEADDELGGYVFARYQLTRRGHIGARYDFIKDELNAISGYYEFFPSEFSKLNFAFERLNPSADDAASVNRILVQATFALGPHKPHPF